MNTKFKRALYVIALFIGFAAITHLLKSWSYHQESDKYQYGCKEGGRCSTPNSYCYPGMDSPKLVCTEAPKNPVTWGIWRYRDAGK